MCVLPQSIVPARHIVIATHMETWGPGNDRADTLRRAKIDAGTIRNMVFLGDSERNSGFSGGRFAGTVSQSRVITLLDLAEPSYKEDPHP